MTGHPKQRSTDTANGRVRELFDLRVSVGSLINLAAIVIAAVVYFGDLKAAILVIQNEISWIKVSVAEIKGDLATKADKTPTAAGVSRERL